MTRRTICLIGLSLTCAVFSVFIPAGAQSDLPDEFFGGVWSPQGDQIALLTPSELWIFTDELQFVQQLNTYLPDASTDEIPDIRNIQWSPDGTRFAAIVHFEGVVEGVSGLYNYLLIWNTAAWERVATVRHVRASSSLAWDPDSSEIAIMAGTFGADLQIYDTQNGNYVRSIASTVIEGIGNFDWNPVNPNEMAIIIGGELELWNPITSEQLTVLTTFHSDLAPSYNPQTAKLAFVNSEFNVEVWDTQTRRLVRMIDAPEDIISFGWVSDDLLTSEPDDTRRRWDTQSGQSTVIPTDAGYRSWQRDGSAYLLFAPDRLVLTETTTRNAQAQLVLSAASQVSSFSALNGLTNQTLPGLSPLAMGAEIDLGQIGSANLVLRANTNPATVGSVVFDLNGAPAVQIDDAAPYDFTNWTPAPGQYTLTATPYSEVGGAGTAGESWNITVTVIDSH